MRHAKPLIYFDGEKWRMSPFSTRRTNAPEPYTRALHFCQKMNEKRAMQYFTKG